MIDRLKFRKIMVIKSKLGLSSWNLTNGAGQGNLQWSGNQNRKKTENNSILVYNIFLLFKMDKVSASDEYRQWILTFRLK